jgi:hypothetical protein
MLTFPVSTSSRDVTVLTQGLLAHGLIDAPIFEGSQECQDSRGTRKESTAKRTQSASKLDAPQHSARALSRQGSPSKRRDGGCSRVPGDEWMDT